MEHLRQIEDDIRNIGLEAKKKYPEIKDATDRALSSLRTIREVYISDMMRKDENSQKSQKFPTSSDLTSPYILTCNYADGSPKLISMSLNGLQLLLNYEVVPPSDVKNILRVLCIQVGTGRTDHHLKILQILILLINLLLKDETTVQYMTDTTLNSLLTLSLQLCDGRSSVSVASTALATVKQILSAVMFETEKVCLQSVSLDTGNSNLLSINSGITSSSINLINDMSKFLLGQSGDWLRGLALPQINALDFMYDCLTIWKSLFKENGLFRSVLIERIVPAVKILLRNLQEDYLQTANKFGLSSASSLISREVRLARCILIDYLDIEIIPQCDLLVTLLIHNLQPDRGNGGNLSITTVNPPPVTSPKPSTGSLNIEDVIRSKLDEATSLFSSTSSNIFMSKLNLSALQAQPPVTKQPSNSSNKSFQITPSFYLTLVNVGPVALNSSSTNIMNMSVANQIPAHPAGVCLEVMISFYLSDISLLLSSSAGCQFIQSSIIATIIAVSTIITGALGVESNRRELETAIKNNQFSTLLEGVLTGTETDLEYVLRTIHEVIVSSLIIEPADLLILAFELLQITIRILSKLSYHLIKLTYEENQLIDINISNEVIKDLPLTSTSNLVNKNELRNMLSYIVENVNDPIQEVCLILLSTADNAILNQRSLGILSELAIISGMCGMTKILSSILSSICKLTVPKWHGQEMLSNIESPVHTSNDSFRKKHNQILIRLLQIVHVLGDLLIDWDVVIDSFEQVIANLTALKLDHGDNEINSTDLEKITRCFEKFVTFSVCLSDDTLIKLMSSLVVLSMNSFSNNASGSIGTKVNNSMVYSYRVDIQTPHYLTDAINSGIVPFSLQAVIEISKINCYRISSIWQMVTSHFRMISSQKNRALRALAVQATHDIINTSLRHMVKPSLPSSSVEFLPTEGLPKHLHIRNSILLSDEIVFSHILPSVETIFHPRLYHRDRLIGFIFPNYSKDVVDLSTLSRTDLLSSLRVLSSVHYEDVKNDIITGLLVTLQNEGQMFIGAWSDIVDILSMVPSSIDNCNPLTETSTSSASDNSIELTSEERSEKKWSKYALTKAFECMKVIIDEFQDLLAFSDVNAVINCLSLFSSQSQDINISLTSVELLWKVVDVAIHSNINKDNDKNSIESILLLMLQSLQFLAMDSRPEIRHCAMNTLFGAIVANANRLSADKWRYIFLEILLPLFDKAGIRSALAMKHNEEANMPELKKGVKMTVHHSRDTAHKQWSETQVLALKGIARVLKVCTKLLLDEEWFNSCWIKSIEVCKSSLRVSDIDSEVSIAGLDSLFNMLKYVSMHSNDKIVSDQTTSQTNVKSPTAVSNQLTKSTSVSSTSSNLSIELNSEKNRQELWYITWKSLLDSCYCDIQSIDSSIYFVQRLMSFYILMIDSEFRYNENIRVMLVMIAIIARPRDITNPSKAFDIQLHRLIFELLHKVVAIDMIGITSLISALAEITFSNQMCQLLGVYADKEIYLSSCHIKSRSEASEMLLSSLKELTKSDVQLSVKLNELIIKKFVEDIYFHILNKRFVSSIEIISSNYSDILNNHISIGNYANSIINDVLSKKVNKKQIMKQWKDKSIYSSPSGNLTVCEKNNILQFNNRDDVALDNTLEIKTENIQNDKFETIADNNSIYWIPCHMPMELQTIQSIILLSTQSQLSTQLLHSIGCYLACILSPWTKSEIFLPDYDFENISPVSIEESSSIIVKTLNILFKRFKHDDKSTLIQGITAIIKTVINSCRLSIYATYSVWNERKIDEDEEDISVVRRLAFAKYYESIWSSVALGLSTMLSDNINDPVITDLIISSLITLANDLTNYLSDGQSINLANNSYHPLIQGLEFFLKVLIDVPNGRLLNHITVHRHITPYPVLLSYWLDSFINITSNVISNSIINLNNLSKEKPNESTKLTNSIHLFYLLPIAIRLISLFENINTGSRKNICLLAKEIIELININEITETIKKLESENIELLRINQQLRAEVSSLKSAASLPF